MPRTSSSPRRRKSKGERDPRAIARGPLVRGGNRLTATISGRHSRRSNMKIVVIGGSGLIGKKLIPILRERGHEAVSASPSSGVNTVTGEGLAEALKGAQVVVDVTNAPSWEDRAVLEFFETSTRNILAAEAVA